MSKCLCDNKVCSNIFYVGVQDPDLRVFDIVMYTPYGTSYNAYVVKGTEKTALFETCKAPFFDTQLQEIQTVTDVSKIDYLVMQHTEPDHSGSIEKLLQLAPDITIVGTIGAITFLKEILNREFKHIVVKDGDTLPLGGKTLQFLQLPFLHWPDTMYTYIPEDETLMTCDSFGCHFSSPEVFNDVTEDFDGFMDAYKYYFDNIIGPYKIPYMVNALKKIEPLRIKRICNGHGPVIRSNPQRYIDMYKEWCKPQPKTNTVTVVYATAYGYTRKLAEEIARGITYSGVKVEMFDVVKDDLEKAKESCKKSDGVLLGSCTILGDSLPPINDIVNCFNPTVDKGKLAGAFGSFGWSGEAVPNLEARLKLMKLNVVEGYRVRLNPSDAQLQGAYEFGKKFAQQRKG